MINKLQNNSYVDNTGYHIKISDYYFVHSYKFSPLDSKTIISSTNYGEDFVSSLGRDNILGTQFHPEKSQAAGVTLLKNFIEWSP